VAYLLITVEGKPPTRRALDGPTIVGRAIDSAVWLDDRRLSRQHCRFEPSTTGEPDSWTLIDLNSKNGTIVKGERISTHKLVDGDEVFVGRARLVFHARYEPPKRPSAPSIESGSAVKSKPAPSPADTLVDSRFPLPRINPHGKPELSDRPERLDRSATPRPSNNAAPAQRPLPFQRPPARPQVDDSHLNVFSRIWRRIRRIRLK
jgi:pSer/pThr/pTyr-binding forkhead associated (FHA) protein